MCYFVAGVLLYAILYVAAFWGTFLLCEWHDRRREIRRRQR
jgi:hypothetical protein